MSSHASVEAVELNRLPSSSYSEKTNTVSSSIDILDVESKNSLENSPKNVAK